MGVKHDGNDGLTRKVKRRRGRPYKVQAPLDVSRDYGYVTKKKLDTWLNYWIANNDMVKAAIQAHLWDDLNDPNKKLDRRKIADRCKHLLQKRPEILERKYEILEERLKDSIAAADEVLKTASEIMRNEAKEDMVMEVGEGKGMQRIERVKKDMSGLTRMKAVEFLGKHYGLADNKVKLEGSLPVVIQDDM